jgi:hypothetical protein
MAEEQISEPPEDPLAAAREKSDQERNELREKATAWVDDRWADDWACPACESDTWYAHQPVSLYPLGTPPFDGAVLPVCPITCTQCGYTVFLNLLSTGLAQPREKTEDESEPDEPVGSGEQQ